MAEISEELIGCPWPIEDIPDNCELFRQAPRALTHKKEGRRFPNEAVFSLKDSEDGLSLDWDKYTAPRTSIMLIGLRFKHNVPNEYQCPNHVIFKLPSSLLRSFSSLTEAKLSHDPIFYGSPSEVGRPNNRAHSQLYYSQSNLEIRLLLTDYCNNNHTACYFEINDVLEFNRELDALRERLNDTPFHNT